MKEYFLIYDNDEPISLGTDNGFGVFWGEQGITALMQMVDKHPDELTKVVIKTDKGKKMSVSEFLEAIAQLKVRV
tara:strand:- start:944 stop:1168 length:225 start_codon:yes stop_codon:yes gene_type:complete